jgi:hypothetical protein
LSVVSCCLGAWVVGLCGTRPRGRCVVLCCTVFGQFSLLTVHSLLLNEMAELLPIQKKKIKQVQTREPMVNTNRKTLKISMCWFVVTTASVLLSPYLILLTFAVSYPTSEDADICSGIIKLGYLLMSSRSPKPHLSHINKFRSINASEAM